MKTQFRLLFVALLSIGLLSSCKKEKTDQIKNVTLDVTINAGDTYSLGLSQYGDADDVATITTQAITYKTSEIVKVGVLGTYNFVKDGSPKVGGNGNETVVLKVAEPARGGRCNKVDETNITINFTIL